MPGGVSVEVSAPKLEQVTECLLGTPRGHKHLRLAVRYGERVLILPEAVVAAVVRAYVTVKTHPQRRAVHLSLAEMEGVKDGFAALQLLETDRWDDEIESLLAELLDRAP